MEGTNHRDRIQTGAGRDVVRARGGDDVIEVGDLYRTSRHEADTVWGGAGNDRISSTGGQERLSGGPGDDVIESGGGGNDVLLGGGGDDVFYASIGDTSGTQAWEGGSGTDSVQITSSLVNRRGAASTGTWNMATGALTFTLAHRIRLTVAGLERAVLATPGTAWSVTGTTGDDAVSGDANSTTSPVTFDGLAGDDTFRGTDGDDVFDGGPGNDHSYAMFGGDDTCISVETIDGADCEHVS